MSASAITFGSVCSGIEAASVAWHTLAWRAVWLAEIEKFPSAVLSHHYPDVPNLGDMTKLARMVLTGEIEAPDVLVGGTPCQAYSVAGMRAGLRDERGQLTLRFMELADAIDFIRVRDGKPPVIIVWENVPGVLSDKTNAFGCFLAGLAGEDVELQPAGKRWTNAGCVYGPQRSIAWRTLDAQYFGLAQRRRRVFVVASARNGFDPAQVLFEWDGVRRDSAPSRSSGKDVAPTLSARTKGGGGLGTDFDLDGGLVSAYGGGNCSGSIDISTALTAHGRRQDFDTEVLLTQCVTGEVTHALKAEGADASEDGTGRGNPIVPVAFDTTQITSVANRSNPKLGDPCHPLAAGAHPPAIAFDCKASGQNGFGVGEIASTLRSMGHSTSHQNAGGHAAVQLGMAVRRLTPRECERLQGFPDDYTLVPHRGKPAADGPRYKALGNSMPAPVMSWIGRRIDSCIAATT